VECDLGSFDHGCGVAVCGGGGGGGGGGVFVGLMVSSSAM